MIYILGAIALIPYAVAGLAFGLMIFLFIILAIKAGYDKFKEWKATGFCRHEFELNRTNSYGQHHWYKCKHCKTERLK
jgi:hypothetical protein